MSNADDPYPGATAPPEDVARLAGSYRAAAHLLAASSDGKSATNRAPWRLTAIHAIELYLNAFLRLSGRSPSEIRGLQHDMAKISAAAVSCGFRFRAKTLAHLVSLGETRAYLVTRYDPVRSAGTEQPNRVLATLDEVAAKVERALAQAAARQGAEKTDKPARPAATTGRAPAAAEQDAVSAAAARERPATPVAPSAAKTRSPAPQPKGAPSSAAAAEMVSIPGGKAKPAGRPAPAKPGTSPGGATPASGGKAKPTDRPATAKPGTSPVGAAPASGGKAKQAGRTASAKPTPPPGKPGKGAAAVSAKAPSPTSG